MRRVNKYSKTWKISAVLAAIAVLVGSFALMPRTHAAAGWQYVGARGFSNASSYYTSLAFGSNGTPYVAYQDGNNSNKATVMDYTGGSWQTLGSAGFSAGQVQYISLAMNGNTPYVAYEDGNNSNKATVMDYTGGSWQTVGSAGFSAGQAQYLSLVINGGTPYLAYQDAGNSGRATVMEYTGGNWLAVGSAGFTSDGVEQVSLAFDGSTPYVVYEDNSNSEADVMKYDSGTNTWEYVGSPGFSGGGAYGPVIAFDGDTPYVAYPDGSKSSATSVMKYDGSAWVYVGTQGFTPDTPTRYIQLAFSGDTPYVAFDGSGNYGAGVMQYNGSAWVYVGSDQFSNGEADHVSLAMDGNTPYVAYRDKSDNSYASVMQYYTPGPTTPGTPTTTTPTNNNKPTWSWTASTESSGPGLADPAYTVEWSQQSDFSDVTGATTATTNNTSFTQPASLADGTWYFRVQAADTAGTDSSWSNGSATVDTSAPNQPTASPSAGSYNSNQSVALSATDNSGGSGINAIYYTTDGSTPSSGSTKYTGAINVSSSETIKAVAYDNAGNASSVASFDYNVDTSPPSTPTPSVAAGYYDSVQSVTLSSSDSGSGLDAIYYTTDGSTPTNASTKYTSAINIDSDTTLKAIAYDKVGNASSVMSASYQIDTTKLIGGSNVTNEMGSSSSITDLQVSSNETNPTVSVKLFVNHGVISMGTTTGLTFYDSKGVSLGSTQPSNAASLQISGAMNDVNTALATLHYTRTDGQTGSDSLSASLIPQGSAYNSANGHLYQYVGGSNTWAAANAAANASSQYGAEGYLATVTSSSENDFIANQLQSDSWIGGSDASSEGNWIWTAGPEANEQFWQGDGSGHTVNSMYAHWNNPTTGGSGEEPNGGTSENCLEFYSSNNGLWNDLSCTNTLGYVIEYGGLNGVNPTISSKTVSITTQDTTAPSAPGTPSTTSPTNDTTPTWTWTASADSGTGLANPAYTVEWSAKSDFSDVSGATTATTGNTSYTQPSALTGGTWYFRVRAADNAGNNSAWTSNFVVIDIVNPSLKTTTPATGAVDVPVSSNLTINFSKAVVADSGDIVIKKSADNSTVETIPVTSAQVNVNGSTATITPSSNLSSWTAYYVTIDPTAFKDASFGNHFAGISSDSAWTFTTVGTKSATVSNAGTSAAVQVQTPAGTNITCNSSTKASSEPNQDGSYSYPLGLINFCFGTPDASNLVSLTFITNLQPDQVVARKYDPTNKTYADVPNATITETTLNGQPALQLSYTITDNGPLDTNPAVGEITDPVGLAMADTSSSTTKAPDTGYGVSHGSVSDIIIYSDIGSLSLIALAVGLRKLARRYN